MLDFNERRNQRLSVLLHGQMELNGNKDDGAIMGHTEIDDDVDNAENLVHGMMECKDVELQVFDLLGMIATLLPLQ